MLEEWTLCNQMCHSAQWLQGAWDKAMGRAVTIQLSNQYKAHSQLIGNKFESVYQYVNEHNRE